MYENYYQQQPSQNSSSNSSVDVKSSSFLSRVYAYMGIGVLISAIVAFGTGYGFFYWFATDSSDAAFTTYLYVLIGSLVGMLILSFIVNFTALRGKHSIMVPAIIYSVLMGVVFSEFTLFVDFWSIGSAFAITAMTFGIMYLIARFTKRNLNWLATLGIGLLCGAMMMSLFLLVIYFFANSTTSFWISALIDGLIFLAILFVTMFDVWRIQKIANQGIESKNLALYCAFTLYVDFMYILMRVIFIIARFSGNKN